MLQHLPAVRLRGRGLRTMTRDEPMRPWPLPTRTLRDEPPRVGVVAVNYNTRHLARPLALRPPVRPCPRSDPGHGCRRQRLDRWIAVVARRVERGGPGRPDLERSATLPRPRAHARRQLSRRSAGRGCHRSESGVGSGYRCVYPPPGHPESRPPRHSRTRGRCWPANRTMAMGTARG